MIPVRIPLPRRETTQYAAGWRTVGDQECHFRSSWEANYARYLEWLRGRSEIRYWRHESRTFWFPKIKRGVCSYLPDFEVGENNGVVAWHEVKGQMDARSRTKLRRMRLYHPNERMVLIDQRQYRAMADQLRLLVPDWE